MLDTLKKSFLASLGAVDLSKEKIKQAVDKLAEKGKIDKKDAKKLVDDLIARGQKERARLEKALDSGLKKGFSLTGLVTRGEYDKLQKKVQHLEAELKKLKK